MNQRELIRSSPHRPTSLSRQVHITLKNTARRTGDAAQVYTLPRHVVQGAASPQSFPGAVGCQVQQVFLHSH